MPARQAHPQVGPDGAPDRRAVGAAVRAVRFRGRPGRGRRTRWCVRSSSSSIIVLVTPLCTNHPGHRHHGGRRPLDVSTELTLIALVLGSLAVTALCRRYGLPAPLVLVVAGLLASLVPGVVEVTFDPNVVMLLVLTPLLYSAGLGSSYAGIRANLRPIGLLAVGLVAFTTVVVGLVAWWVVPGLTLPAGLVLGAIVAPARRRLGADGGPPARAAAADDDDPQRREPGQRRDGADAVPGVRRGRRRDGRDGAGRRRDVRARRRRGRGRGARRGLGRAPHPPQARRPAGGERAGAAWCRSACTCSRRACTAPACSRWSWPASTSATAHRRAATPRACRTRPSGRRATRSSSRSSSR